MTTTFTHGTPWKLIADVEGVSLGERRRFRLRLEHTPSLYRLRLLQKTGHPPILWLPVAELLGDDPLTMLTQGRAIAYAQLATEGDYIDWDDELNPDVYPATYCYICKEHSIDCMQPKQ